MMFPARTVLHLPILLAGIVGLGGCGSSDREEADIRRAPPIFCYRTLAEPDCYAVPQPGPPNRIIGMAPVVFLPR
jgi:hypothetical protein